MALEELYQHLLLEHARSPKNRGAIPPPAVSLSLQNPLCGDEITVSCKLRDGVVQEAKFLGSGCMISQAATSLLIDAVQGRNVDEAKDILQEFRKLMRGEDVQGNLGELRSIEGVKRFPIRIKCALLAADALERVLVAEAPAGD